MPKSKKSWKESQRARQAKQQSAEEARQMQQEQNSKKKSRSLPKGKILLIVTLVLLALGVYAAIQLAATPAVPTTFIPVHIRADGSVDPSNASISTVTTNQYAFTADFYGSIVIEK